MEPSLRSPPLQPVEDPIPPVVTNSTVTVSPFRSPPHPETMETISESLTLPPPNLDSEHHTALPENDPHPVTVSEVPSPEPQDTKEPISESVTLQTPILDAEHHTAPTDNRPKENPLSFRSLIQEASPSPVTVSAVRSPPRPGDMKETRTDMSSSFRSLLQKTEDPTASQSLARSPREERTIGESLPLRSLLMSAEHHTKSPSTRHQNENSLSSASSFKLSRREPAEDPTASPPPPLALTVASILSSPGADVEEGAADAAAANGVVKRGVGTASWKGKVGGRRRRVVRKPEMAARAAAWLRISAVVLSMVSFSVMAADRTSGWAGDSFERYREFRYCFSINVIAFVYSSFQVFVQVLRMCTKQRIMSQRISYYFDFSMDQIIAYLLMSASSSAASRNDDWVLSFGSDDFTKMMDGSIAMSFLAFFALAFSSLISAYKLFSLNN